MESNIISVPTNEIWLTDGSEHHIVIPPIAAFRFVEAYFGQTLCLDIFRNCATSVKKIGSDVILNRNFLSWTPWSKRLTQCAFKKAKPLDGVALEFPPEVTSKIFKCIDSERAAMVIYTDTMDNKELLFYANRYFGISDAVLMADNLYPGPITTSYHNYVAPVVVTNLEDNPEPTTLPNADYIALSKILHDLVRIDPCNNL